MAKSRDHMDVNHIFRNCDSLITNLTEMLKAPPSQVLFFQDQDLQKIKTQINNEILHLQTLKMEIEKLGNDLKKDLEKIGKNSEVDEKLFTFNDKLNELEKGINLLDERYFSNQNLPISSKLNQLELLLNSQRSALKAFISSHSDNKQFSKRIEEYFHQLNDWKLELNDIRRQMHIRNEPRLITSFLNKINKSNSLHLDEVKKQKYLFKSKSSARNEFIMLLQSFENDIDSLQKGESLGPRKPSSKIK